MKQKRKAQPINLKRYWIGFSLLAILLLIPFRIINHFNETVAIYTVIAILVSISMVYIFKQIGWKNRITILLLLCLILPIYQIAVTRGLATDAFAIQLCNPDTRGAQFRYDERGLYVNEDIDYMIMLEPIYCHVKHNDACALEYLAIKHTPMMLQIGVNPFQDYWMCG